MRLVAKGIIVAGPPCAMNIFLWLVALPLVTVLGTWENHVFANFPRASTVVWDNFSLHWWVRWWPCRCAMMRHDVPRSSSVHQRHVYGPEGNQQNAKVRMSNRLVKNFCVWLELLARHRKFWFVIEQPTSSWLFKMQAMVSIMAAMACVKVTTWNLGSIGHTGFLLVWFGSLVGGTIVFGMNFLLYWSTLRMGFFSHDLPKPTHLVGTLPDLGQMKRRMTKADRARIAARLDAWLLPELHFFCKLKTVQRLRTVWQQLKPRGNTV